ncbi:Hypothetical predicted protein [Lecanosticta acicola]|uniref:Uncharacterized protein n=1 Tax=Lecanosticta acicola TaxID=111012 RepID=A0AAI8YXJ5_9PEZI|nr:Hypothetical predicted protein [Lecanosticta acicola]
MAQPRGAPITQHVMGMPSVLDDLDDATAQLIVGIQLADLQEPSARASKSHHQALQQDSHIARQLYEAELKFYSKIRGFEEGERNRGMPHWVPIPLEMETTPRRTFRSTCASHMLSVLLAATSTRSTASTMHHARTDTAKIVSRTSSAIP